MLSNGMGGVDWSGMPFVTALLGVDDVEALVNDLMVIKGHKPEPEKNETNTDEH